MHPGKREHQSIAVVGNRSRRTEIVIKEQYVVRQGKRIRESDSVKKVFRLLEFTDPLFYEFCTF
jgi:hypothetical protein